jgi:hypothetical protein
MGDQLAPGKGQTTGQAMVCSSTISAKQMKGLTSVSQKKKKNLVQCGGQGRPMGSGSTAVVITAVLWGGGQSDRQTNAPPSLEKEQNQGSSAFLFWKPC